MEKQKWFGTWPANCDFCKADLTHFNYFVDGRTGFGPWALMCVSCYRNYGVGMGTGSGQLYNTQTLEKVSG